MTRHGELGAALHRWRDRISPAEGGLPEGGPEDPGMGRTELARLTGLSVDYITRLEQGRATTPSSQVLASLARALRLDDVERRHLFLLAGHSPPATDRVPRRVPPSVRRMLDGMTGTAVGVHDAAWSLITFNPLWAALLGDPSKSAASPCRNVAWRHFTEAPSRVTRTPEQAARFEMALIGDLRAAAARYPTDVDLRALVAELRRASGRFTELWTSRMTGSHESESVTVHHPDVGAVTVDYDIITVPGCDLRVIAQSAAPGSRAAEAFDLLGAWSDGPVPLTVADRDEGHEQEPAAV
ncbi:helix-turn-helix transcriptional regulator [Streptomyces montanisoli]|uniref:Helix-turn-helix domain-containing protein n=1 Tax=Streptomyces montanisoli TaxID=2798581 RepID=A0A940ML25_9ACTN|nr:helix-turn-helix transcriptional regulator [Streptomyces montanisoli]MBP0462095.1 helix-turn-helix domain-containing protein [Streptomyces montanisoli]